MSPPSLAAPPPFPPGKALVTKLSQENKIQVANTQGQEVLGQKSLIMMEVSPGHWTDFG